MLPISLPPWDMMWDALCYGVLPPFAVAAIVLMIAERCSGAKHSAASAALALLLAIVFGLWLRTASFNGWPRSPEQSWASAVAIWLRTALTPMSGESAWNRLPWAALGMLCVGRLARLPELPALDAGLLRAAASLAAAWLVIPIETQEEFAWLMPTFALVVFAEWTVLEVLAAEPPGGTLPFANAAAFFVASLVLIQTGWTSLSQAAIVVGSTWIGIALVATWRRADGGGGTAITALLLPSMMLMGQQQDSSDLPWQAFALTAGAPLALALTLPLRHSQSVWLRGLQIVLILLPLGAALYWTGPIKFEELEVRK